MKALRIPGRRATVIATTAATVAAWLAFVPVATVQAQTTSCLAVDSDVNVWSTSPGSGGFAHNVTLINTCAEPVDGWTLQLALPPGQAVDHHWSATVQVLDDQVTFTPMAWNAAINPDASTNFGFIGDWTGTYQDPLSCRIDGVPCDGGAGNEPPEVTLTGPADGDGIASPCPVQLTADASDPDGAVDRVEFYVNDTLVGTDDEAPYGVEVASIDSALSLDNTAFARVFDDGSPALSTDSTVVSFFRPVPPPALMLIACTPAVEVEAGGSATATFATGACPGASQVELTVDGDAGITVSPTSYTPSSGGFGDDVTVSAAPGTTGATATLTATATTVDGIECITSNVPITVVDGDPGENQPPEVVQTGPVGLTGWISPCGITLAADAGDPDGAVDRVEFYVNDVLVGTDDTAPYRTRMTSLPMAGNVAFARAYDDGVPQLSTDSEPVTFQIAIGDLPPGVIFPCTSSLTVTAGSSAEIRFAHAPSTVVDELVLTVTGDPGVTASAATAIADGFRATVNAAAGSAGATATITATADGFEPVTVSITVG